MRSSKTKSGAELAHAKTQYMHCDISPKPLSQNARSLCHSKNNHSTINVLIPDID
ncbi:MAG: hypothetical protein WBM86_26815 [Waterburya sp.]